MRRDRRQENRRRPSRVTALRRREPPVLIRALRRMKSAATSERGVRLAAVVTATAVLATAFMTYQTLDATRHQIAISDRNELTGRFIQASAQLGEEQIEVRVGAIYALQRLAFDSERERTTIVELLGTFARSRAPVSAACGGRGGSETGAAEPGNDVLAAVTVLGRLNREPVAGEKRPNLRGMCLARADLAGIDLRGVNLIDTNLTEADLHRADLRGAAISHANFTSARLTFANLSEIRSDRTIFADTWLDETRIIDSEFRDADFRKATIFRSDLEKSTLFCGSFAGLRLDDPVLLDREVAFGGGLDVLLKSGPPAGYRPLHIAGGDPQAAARPMDELVRAGLLVLTSTECLPPLPAAAR
ncbi:pentapeptide repeat-containing protein [Nocardia asteroides]|uniref:pentapeptide repeat-containing protein n=1 Tax=Nocardia asteroides TaxID=1824 RepID=UPI001E2BB369|nr:pentapeptide repeat-containing protein [Nocardia asteroides]UGT60580.1 pentapeptide repeat-containing protein [Nocardia asteroides]